MKLRLHTEKLALELHPDKKKTNDDGKKFQEINEAYNILKMEYKSPAAILNRNRRKIEHTLKNKIIKNEILLGHDHNGDHLQVKQSHQNKIGVNIQVNLKMKIQTFGKNMKENSGKNTIKQSMQMEKMANMRKQKNQKFSQISLLM